MDSGRRGPYNLFISCTGTLPPSRYELQALQPSPVRCRHAVGQEAAVAQQLAVPMAAKPFRILLRWRAAYPVTALLA